MLLTAKDDLYLYDCSTLCKELFYIINEEKWREYRTSERIIYFPLTSFLPYSLFSIN